MIDSTHRALYSVTYHYLTEVHMDYLKQAKETIEAGGGVDLMSSIHVFENPGDELAGIVESVDDFTGGEFDTVVNRYTLNTGEKRVSCILGSATDRAINQDGLVGKLIYIRFEGQKDAKHGKRYNVYTVKEIAAPSRKKA